MQDLADRKKTHQVETEEHNVEKEKILAFLNR